MEQNAQNRSIRWRKQKGREEGAGKLYRAPIQREKMQRGDINQWMMKTRPKFDGRTAAREEARSRWPGGDNGRPCEAKHDGGGDEQERNERDEREDYIGRGRRMETRAA